MKYVFDVNHFLFPYEGIKFPGQASDERILYITRESGIKLWQRLLVLALASLVMVVCAMVIPELLDVFGRVSVEAVRLVALIVSIVFVGVGGWWLMVLWRKSVFILTNRRLTKFIYTTPWNRYNLSITLDRIDDTGAYTRGTLQALFGMGTFTARSSAGNRKDKYFYIENIHFHEDLANYVNKLLFHYDRNIDKLDSFRPFMPFLKGNKRKKYMEKFPHFWS